MGQTKEQLAIILRRATLTRSEREAFEDIWDRIHRYGRVSDKQKAWIERVYFGQNLDKEPRAVEPIRRRVRVVDAKDLRPSKQPTAQQQKLKQTGTFMAVKAPAKKSRVGYINYPGVQSTQLITNMTMFRQACPRIKPGSVQFQKIQRFFESGGEVLRIKPVEAVSDVA